MLIDLPRHLHRHHLYIIYKIYIILIYNCIKTKLDSMDIFFWNKLHNKKIYQQKQRITVPKDVSTNLIIFTNRVTLKYYLSLT